MIHDKLENLHNYIRPRDFELIKTTFLRVLSPNMEERKYDIDGDRIYAKVMSYDTKDSSICKIEAHNVYIDIQCTITGAEGIDIYERDGLGIAEPYNTDKDVIFYEKEEKSFHAHTENLEGYFTLLLPDEAHAPQQRVGNIEQVKKFVIKYAVGSFYEDIGA